MKKEIILVILLIISTSILTGCINTTDNNNGTTNKDIGLDFVFTSTDGSEKHLSDYRGKIVILDTWATWCTPCVVVMIELKKVYENYSRDDLEILSINIESREGISEIENYRSLFVSQLNIELDWIFGNDKDGSISEKYLKGGAIPTLVIFDENGEIYYSEAGVHGFTEIPYGYSNDTPLIAPILNEIIT